MKKLNVQIYQREDGSFFLLLAHVTGKDEWSYHSVEVDEVKSQVAVRHL